MGEQLRVQVRQGMVRMGWQQPTLKVKGWVEHGGSGRRWMGADRRRVPVGGRVLQVGRGWIRPEKGRDAETVARFLGWVQRGRYRDARRRGGGRGTGWARCGVAIVLVADLLHVYVHFLLFHVHVHLAVSPIRRGRVGTGRVRRGGTPRRWRTHQAAHSEGQSFWKRKNERILCVLDYSSSFFFFFFFTVFEESKERKDRRVQLIVYMG